MRRKSLIGGALRGVAATAKTTHEVVKAGKGNRAGVIGAKITKGAKAAKGKCPSEARRRGVRCGKPIKPDAHGTCGDNLCQVWALSADDDAWR